MAENPEYRVNRNLYAGIDVGGTKVHILDSQHEHIHRYATRDYASMENVLDTYFATLGQRPFRVCVAMAGPRDDDTGNVKGTNFDWPEFSPAAAAVRFPGTHFETVNDMVGTTAGVLVEQSVELQTIKPGVPTPHGTKLVVALSTGIGAAAAVWDKRSQRYVFVAGEGGHIGFQPKTATEAKYLEFLQGKHTHASAELALSGKHGIESLTSHSLEFLPVDKLDKELERARQDNRPVGAVLREVAEQGEGSDQDAARIILHNLGNMIGSVLRDLTVTFNASGGVYLTGSVALALGDYFAEKTDFTKRFIQPGAVHDERLEKIPLYVVMDPNVAVKGALALAQETN